jgi:hypothetical protein
MEIITMRQINFDAPAMLEKDVYGVANGKLAFLCCEGVRGSLRACLDAFDEKPDSEKPLYSILVADAANLPKAYLGWLDIESLVPRLRQSSPPTA